MNKQLRQKFDRVMCLIDKGEWTIEGNLSTDCGFVIISPKLVTSSGLKLLEKEFDNSVFFSSAHGGFVV